MSKSIKVSISPIGDVKVEANGFNGMGCTDATAPIENALSGTAGLDRTLKSEAYQIETNEDEHESVNY